jgi:hypothetical protein
MHCAPCCSLRCLLAQHYCACLCILYTIVNYAALQLMLHTRTAQMCDVPYCGLCNARVLRCFACATLQLMLQLMLRTCTMLVLTVRCVYYAVLQLLLHACTALLCIVLLCVCLLYTTVYYALLRRQLRTRTALLCLCQPCAIVCYAMLQLTMLYCKTTRTGSPHAASFMPMECSPGSHGWWLGGWPFAPALQRLFVRVCRLLDAHGLALTRSLPSRGFAHSLPLASSYASCSVLSDTS